MPVIVVSAVLGFCGLIYEFVFAQTLSVLFGQSVIQYSITIGLFVAGMGVGSHIAVYFQDPRRTLWRVQLELSILAPLAAVLIWTVAVSGYMTMARIGAYFAILGVGLLTGMELPLLLRLRGEWRTGYVLSADYGGMLFACLLFPLLLLPTFGVFTTLFITALLNSLISTFLMPSRGLLTATVAAVLILSLFFEPTLREWLSQRLIAG